MRSRLASLMSALLMLSVGGCLTSTGSSGACPVENGTVNTHEIFARWKLVSNYNPPRTKKQLELDFDLLIVKKGTVLCSEKVTNGSVAGRNYIANYSHDITNKKLTFYYPDGEQETATYSFAGACASTTMTLTFPNGTETYELFDPDYGETDCAVATGD